MRQSGRALGANLVGLGDSGLFFIVGATFLPLDAITGMQFSGVEKGVEVCWVDERDGKGCGVEKKLMVEYCLDGIASSGRI